MTPRVTVVIPTRNRRALLEQALGSVLAQTAGDLEVVVVDEGSVDDTPSFLAGHDDPRVRVVRHDQPRGLGAARNAGIASARGRWTAFLDDDDLWAPGKLAAQLDAADRVGGARWASVGAVRVDPALRIVGFHRLADTSDLVRRTLEINLIPGSGSAVMAHTALLRELGGFREDLLAAQDWDMWIRLAAAAPFAIADAPLMAYRISPTGMSHVPDLERRAAEQIRALHGGLAAELGFAPRGDTLEVHLARLDHAVGRRAAAVRRLLGLSRRRVRYLPFAAAAALLPRGWERHVVHVAEPRLWPGWRSLADAWLAPHRARVARSGAGRSAEPGRVAAAVTAAPADVATLMALVHAAGLG